jgi:NodT family efflux transporter outer membrane factor (OMF) lipoprotein
LLRHALAALLGAGPDRGLAIAPPQLTARAFAALPGNLPLDLVGRRPDLVSARLRAESAAARIGVARADFYPSINIVAVAGVQSIGLTDLLRGSSLFSNVGPALRLPVFAQAGTEGRYRAARADYDQAVAVYDQTLLDALRDVADAIAAKRAATNQLQAARTGLDAAAQARRIAELRYREGLTSQLELLVADQALITARRTLALLESQSVVADITLIRVLGGGFSAPTAP